MLADLNPGFLIAAASLGAIVLGLLGHVAVRRVLPGMSARSIAETARDALSVLETRVEQLKSDQVVLQAQIVRLQAENALLREMVTNAAKVDDLRELVVDYHAELMKRLATRAAP